MQLSNTLKGHSNYQDTLLLEEKLCFQVPLETEPLETDQNEAQHSDADKTKKYLETGNWFKTFQLMVKNVCFWDYRIIG